MYRIQAIILYRQKIRDERVRTVLFCEEYGKITAWEKGKELGDIGNIVEVLIERKAWQNHIKNLHVLSLPGLDGWQYEEVIEYLHLLHILYECLPEWSENRWLYNSLVQFIKWIEWKVGKVWFINLMQSKILKILWYLNPRFYESSDSLRSLYSIIHTCSMKSMFSEVCISQEDSTHVKMSILDARHSYSYRH